MSLYIVQSNPSYEIKITDLPKVTDSDLIYAAGGGTIFGAELVKDAVEDEVNLHGGNPKLSLEEEPVYKKCDKVSVLNETKKVEGPKITRGLFKHSFIVDPDTITDGDILKSNSIYYWDEIYTTPLGYFTCIDSGEPSSFQFTIVGNILSIMTNDVNIVPKVGDYLFMQKVPDGYVKPADIDISPISNPADFTGIFTDGISNMPIIHNTESYQARITEVAFSEPSGILTLYTITLDKSLSVLESTEFAFILLNRENTGLQKELFYDTFEQIEVHRKQLLGDPYFNTSTAKPAGRQNHLYYNNGQYLGINNLLSGILNRNELTILDNPFIIFDIDEEIRDRFLPISSSINTETINFEFHLPGIMLQDDTEDMVNVLVNYGQVLNDLNGVGLYGGLYSKASKTVDKRYGWIFYDLRIIVIDESELCMALSYNSNRNYTLPKPIMTSPGNYLTNPTSSISLEVIGLEISNFSPMTIIVNNPHQLTDGTAINVTGVKTKIPGSNLIKNSNANGIRYIKRVFNGATESIDKFYLYLDPSLTISVTPDGEFVNSGIGQSGHISGAKLKHNYFFTYRIKNGRYDSILPYSELTPFNFSKSETDTAIDNVNGGLYLSLPPFTYLDNGYEIDDLEFIIGEWVAENPAKPNEITGFKNVIVISSLDIVSPNSPSNLDPNTNYVISIDDYTEQVAKINNGLGSYHFTDNPTGDPNYDIYNNFEHYNLSTGTLPETLLTSNGKWTIGNLSYKTQVEQYRSKLQIVIKADEWNDTTNPTYNPENVFLNEKYISEVAICDKDSDKPLIYAKISPPVKKTNDLDLTITLSIDF